MAGPEGGTVVDGTISIEHSGATTTINQSTAPVKRRRRPNPELNARNCLQSDGCKGSGDRACCIAFAAKWPAESLSALRKGLEEVGDDAPVVKGLFVGAPVWRIHGLDERLNPELARMVLDLADERRSAHRDVQHELALKMASLMLGRLA